MTRYSSPELGAIAAHMLGDLAATPAASRYLRIAAWTEQLDGDQEALVLSIGLEGLLELGDALAHLLAGHRRPLDQALARGVDEAGELRDGFSAPNSLPDP